MSEEDNQETLFRIIREQHACNVLRRWSCFVRGHFVVFLVSLVPSRSFRACAAECAEATSVDRTEHLHVAAQNELETVQRAAGHDRVLSSIGFGDDIFPNDRLEPCR
jgi:hypothetical protein